jgi:DeoR family glycerol-3-phosphate regulon repressor
MAGGAVRRADGAVIGSTATSLIGQFKVDYAIIGASAIDEEGALLDFDYREVQVGASHHRQCAQRDAGRGFDQTATQRAGAHCPYQPDPDLCHRRGAAGRLANICHSRGIEVIEAMPKPSADIDEPGEPVAPPSTVTRLR